MSAPMQLENDAVQGAAPSCSSLRLLSRRLPGPPRTRRQRRRNFVRHHARTPSASARPQAWRPLRPPAGDVQGCCACGSAGCGRRRVRGRGSRREIRARRLARRAAGRVHAQACRAARGAGARGVLGARADPAPRHPRVRLRLPVRIRAQLGRGERIAARRALEEWVRRIPRPSCPTGHVPCSPRKPGAALRS